MAIGTPTNWNSGPATITWNAIDLGTYQDGVEFTVTPDIRVQTADKWGSSPAGAVLEGISIEAKVTLKENVHEVRRQILSVNDAILAEVIDATGPETDKLTGGGTVGLVLAGAKLVVHRVKDTLRENDVTIHKAALKSLGPVSYKVGDDAVWEVTWMGLIDSTRADGDQMFSIGDDQASV